MKIEVELLSEAIFTNREDSSNSVDLEVLYDDTGIPYMNGKSFKGRLKNEVKDVIKAINSITKKDYSYILQSLFEEKKEAVGNYNAIKFSNLKIRENLRNILSVEVKTGRLNKDEVLCALTDRRYFTSIDDNGIASGLREYRVIKKYSKYYIDLDIQRELSKDEKGILAMGIYALTDIGGMKSRGKGNISCKLLVNNKDITKDYISEFERGIY